MIGESDFELEKQSNHFYRELAAVYVIPEEEILRSWGIAEHLKHPKQVIELAMNIRYDCHRRCYLQQSGFLS